MRLKDAGHAGVFFNVEGRPTGGCGGCAGNAAKVNGDFEVALRGGFVDGMIVAIAVGEGGANWEEDLDKLGAVANASNFFGGEFGVLWRHNDRCAESGFFIEPFVQLPIVYGLGKCKGSVWIVNAIYGVEAVEDADVGVWDIECLFAQCF